MKISGVFCAVWRFEKTDMKKNKYDTLYSNDVSNVLKIIGRNYTDIFVHP